MRSMNEKEALDSVNGMVHMYAKRARFSAFVAAGRLSYEDLLQAGKLGVLIAHSKFNPSINPHFPTYAGWWIQAKMYVECLDKGRTVRISRKDQRDALAAHTSQPFHCKDVELYDLPAPTAEEPLPAEASAMLHAALGSLTKRQRECLTMYYLDGKNMPVIARELGVSRQCVQFHLIRGIRNIQNNHPHLREYIA